MPKVLRSVYMDLEQLDDLKKLSKETRVSQAAYVREGIEYVLNKYQGGNGYGTKKHRQEG